MSEVTDYVDIMKQRVSAIEFQSLCEQARDGRMKWGRRFFDWAPDATGDSG